VSYKSLFHNKYTTRSGIMVVTSKALGLALLSALALAAPFEDSTSQLDVRSADAIAEALLADEFEFGARDAAPEPEFEVADFSDDLIAREAEFDFEVEEPVFARDLGEVEEEGLVARDDDDEKPKKKKKGKKLSKKQELKQWRQVKKALRKQYKTYKKHNKKGTYLKFVKSIKSTIRRMSKRNKRLRNRVKSMKKSNKRLSKKNRNYKKQINSFKAFMKKNKLNDKFKSFMKEHSGKKDKKEKREAIAEPEAWAEAEPWAT